MPFACHSNGLYGIWNISIKTNVSIKTDVFKDFLTSKFVIDTIY